MPEQIPLQSMMRQAMMGQVVHLQLMEVHGGADICLQPVENSTPEGVAVPKEGCDHVRSLC